MGITIISNSGIKAYGIKHYTVDTTKDLENLPTNITAGSTAFIIETSEKYMLNTKKEWKQINE